MLRLAAYVAFLAASAGIVAWSLDSADLQSPGTPAAWAIPVFGVLLVAAEYLFVRFRFRGEVNALNLVEAALAPVLFAYEPVTVILLVAGSQVFGGILRKNAPIKAAFNIAQWALAAGIGAGIVSAISANSGVSWRSIGGLLIGLGVVGIVNQTAFTLVISIAERRSIHDVITGLGPIMLAGWVVGWAVNSAVGLLFVFAYAGHPAAVLLFAVPLVVLHLAYRGYAGARTDRVRLSGLHSAARMLAEPLDPSSAIEPFIQEVAESFEAPAASLVLSDDYGLIVHTVDLREGRDKLSVAVLNPDADDIHASAVLRTDPQRIIVRGDDQQSEQLARAGWRECLTAPVADGEERMGALLVFDQSGLEGFEAGELAVLQAVARETASTMAKGQLLERILQERRRFAEIVETTSDGIATITPEGIIESWNPAMERITGLAATDVIGTSEVLDDRWFATADEEPVALSRWAQGESLPTQLRVMDTRGRPHLLMCSYSNSYQGIEGSGRLVVIARDVTAESEIQELRYEFGRLSRSVDAQRRMVDRLQEAVMPAPLSVAGLELGVSYLASDPLAPTGGDLYDWVQLPTGEVQVAVVDVLGHGVPATKDAVAVVHAFRVLAAQGCPIEEIVAQADRVLGTQDHDVVATVVVVRIDPRTGRARIAAGGHPPPLVTSIHGGVRQIPAPGGPIGWPGAGSIETIDVELAPGESLVLYTDGLIEAGKDILAGEEALMRHARALLESSANEMARGLLERALSDGARRDDSVAVVIRRAPASEQRTWSAHPATAQPAVIRNELRSWLKDRNVDEDTLDDAALIATELLSNAMRAGREKISLRAGLADRILTIEVQDDGSGDANLNTIGEQLPDVHSEGGRGLFVVRAMSDDVQILSTAEGTIVKSVRNLAAAQSSGSRAKPSSESRSSQRY
jgi:PAS domain S-box-containing protein